MLKNLLFWFNSKITLSFISLLEKLEYLSSIIGKINCPFAENHGHYVASSKNPVEGMVGGLRSSWDSRECIFYIAFIENNKK